MNGLWRQSKINFVERNIHGAWVISGSIGIRQYYYYTKKEAIALYRKECAESGPIYNQSPPKIRCSKEKSADASKK